MVALSGPVANARFGDLLADFSSVFQPNAVQFAAGKAAARDAGNLAMKRDKLSMAHAIRLQEMGDRSAASLQRNELRAAADRNKATIRAGRFAGLSPLLVKSLANAFEPQANLGANLLKQYDELTKNRPNLFQAAGDVLTWGNNYQTLIDGLGPNVLAPYMAKGLNEYYDTTVNPFSASLPNPTQGFL